MEYIYAALLLHKLGKEISEENLKRVIESAGAQPDESKIKTLVASLKEVDIEKILSEATITVPQSGQPSQPQPKEEKKKEEKTEEAAIEGLAALFG